MSNRSESTTRSNTVRIQILVAAALVALALASHGTAAASEGEEVTVERDQPKPPSDLFSASLALTPGARAGGSGRFRSAGSEGHTVGRLTLSGEIRLLSFLGIRGGIDTLGTEGGKSHGLRVGLALHCMSSAGRPDLYMYTDLSWIKQGPAAGTRELSIGLGLRVRIARYLVVGIEAGLVQDRIAGGRSNVFAESVARTAQGMAGVPQISGVVGVVF